MVARLVGLAARPRLVLGVGTLVFAVATLLASRLELKTAVSELLPTKEPAVVALERTKNRIGELSLLLVGIRSPDRAANLRYAEALTARLAALPRSVCEMATYHMKDLRGFLEANRWLYISQEDLGEIRDRLRTELVKRKNPFAADLGLDDEPAASDAAKASGHPLAPALARRTLLDDRFPDGVFARGDYVWIATLPTGGLDSENVGDEILAVMRRFVAEHPPSTFHPAMTVMPAGPVMAQIANREAVERDIVSVTIVCILVISASIALYFRSKRWVFIIVGPAVVGTVAAFAVAELAFGYLNSSTAFLGSILVGNGINYAIVLGARYREHRRAGEEAGAAIAAAIEGVWRGTLAAALCASVAYASLMLTGFRGFSQFGLMGAVGALLCWLATFTLVPALIRLTAGRHVPGPLGGVTAFAALGGLVVRRPQLVGWLSVVISVAAVAGLRHFAGAPFEYDFRKLATDLEKDATFDEFDKNLDALFGHWHSPTVLLADRLDQVEPMRQAIRKQDRAGQPYIGQIVTIYDVLPGTPQSQAQKIEILAENRKLATGPGVELLSDEDRRLIAENLPPETLRVLRPDELPLLARRAFTERNGEIGRVILAYHDAPRVTRWNGHDLLGIAGVLERLSLPDGMVITSAGPPMVFGAMLRSVLRDGPLATVLSLLGVAIVLVILVRPLRHAGLVFAALALGVIWMLGIAGAFDVRITFLNFIALPITFGIGAEYAVNVMARLREGNSIDQAIASTGSAVILCSWTTVVGYGSLLAAHSQALRGFGAMAVLGEIACLATAVIALPAFLAWRAAARRPTSP